MESTCADFTRTFRLLSRIPHDPAAIEAILAHCQPLEVSPRLSPRGLHAAYVTCTYWLYLFNVHVCRMSSLNTVDRIRNASNNHRHISTGAARQDEGAVLRQRLRGHHGGLQAVARVCTVSSALFTHGPSALEMFGLTKSAVDAEIRNREQAKLFDGVDQTMLTAKVIYDCSVLLYSVECSAVIES